jgi:hypothetical protein
MDYFTHRHRTAIALAAIAVSLLVASEGNAQIRKKRYSTWVPTNTLTTDENMVGAKNSKKKKTDPEKDTTSLNSGKRAKTGNDVGLGAPITGAGSIPLTGGSTFTLGGGLPGSAGSSAGSGSSPVRLTSPGAPITGGMGTSGMSMPGGEGGSAGGHGGMPGSPGGGSPGGPPGGLPGAPPGGGGGGHGGR